MTAANTADTILEVRQLSVSYAGDDEAVPAVIDVDLAVHRQQVLGLAGESGCGKSTLAMAMTGLLRPPGFVTSGQVMFWPAQASNSVKYDAGREGGGPPPQAPPIDVLSAGAETLRSLRWAHLSVVLQSAMHALNPVLRLEDQLTDVLFAHGWGGDVEERRERAAELLRMVGISRDRLGSFPHELSGGMRQRVMICMALALEPEVLIMDEPTTALDVVTQRDIVEQVISLRDRLDFSVVFITHDLSLLIEMADEIVVMYAGRIVERAGARSVSVCPRHPYTEGLLGSFPPLHGERKRLAGIPGSPPEMARLPPGCSFQPRCRYAMSVCAIERPPLLPLASGQPAVREVACWLHDGTRTVPESLCCSDPRDAGAGLAYGSGM